MGIYIRGIDMPTKGNPITVLIYPDGTAEWEAKKQAGTAISVPPHGRLIDADKLRKLFAENYMWGSGTFTDHQPTIIPEEQEEQNERLRN